MDMSPIYYRILVSDGKAVIATLQDFDEYDYDHSRYLTQRTFETEEDAIAFAQQVYDNPKVPLYIKDTLYSLLHSSYDVDEYIPF